MAKISLKSFIQSSLKFMAGGAYDLFGRNNNWSAGQVLRVTPDQTVESMPTVRFMTVATTDADITNAKGAGFSQIFNTWGRISYSGGNPHYTPSEETQWSFDATTGRVSCTVNSGTVVGFIGPDYYDRYTMEVGISSPDGDDDCIGLCLAYIETNGVTHMLMAARQGAQSMLGAPLGTSKLLNVVYDPSPVDRSGWVVGCTNGSLSYPNGTKPAGFLLDDTGHGGWGDNGLITLKVERTPTTITVWSSDKGSPHVYSDDNKVVVDLTSDNRLSVFIHPCRMGYAALSQMNSTWDVYQQPDYQVPIFDVRDRSMWAFESGQWVKYNADDAAIKAEIPQGILISSIANNTLWYATYTATLRRLTQ